jgi:hypothetical protein
VFSDEENEALDATTGAQGHHTTKFVTGKCGSYFVIASLKKSLPLCMLFKEKI